MVFFRLLLADSLPNNIIRVILPQKYDQLSVGVSGGVSTSGVRPLLNEKVGFK